MAWVYGISDDDTGELLYVGFTTRDPRDRLFCHRRWLRDTGHPNHTQHTLEVMNPAVAEAIEATVLARLSPPYNCHGASRPRQKVNDRRMHADRRTARLAPEEARKTVGTKLRLVRRTLHMTQVELAAAVGVDQGTIARYERGHHVPHPAIQQRIADALGQPHDELFAEVA